MPRKVFVAGEILTAADVNTNLMDQAVMSFAGTAARGSAIPSPTEGMTAYLSDSDVISIYDGSAWKSSLKTTGAILQAVTVAKADTFSTTSSSLADVTGLTASITPLTTSSRIVVLVSVILGSSGSGQYGVTVADGSDNNLIAATSPGSRVPAFYRRNDNNEQMTPASFALLHSPNTTSAFTYKVRALTSAGTLFVNRSGLDTDTSTYSRGVSTITLLEVAG